MTIPLASKDRLLLVDDDIVARTLARAMLRQAGFEVTIAENGEAALESFERERYALVLLDVLMPGIDGFEVCRRLREHPHGGKIPIIMITALTDAEPIERAYALGATDFIPKPINRALLTHRVRYNLQAADAMAVAERRGESLLRAQRLGRMGHWEWSAHDEFFNVSAPLRELFGLTQDNGHARTLLGLQTQTSYADRERVELARYALMQEGVGYEISYGVNCADGRHLDVCEQAVALRDGAGRIIGAEGIIQDISAHRQAEARLQQATDEAQDAIASMDKSISLMSATLESVENGILVTDRDRRITTFNQRLLRMWQFSTQVIARSPGRALLSHAMEQLTNPQQLLEKIETLYFQPEADSFDVIHFKDGRIFEVYSHPQLLGNEVMGRVWSFLDITQRQQAENALRMLSTALEQSPSGVVIVDLSGRVEYINSAFSAISGYALDEAVGQAIHRLQIDASNDAPQLVQARYDDLWNTMERGEIWQGEFTLRRKNGEIYVESTLAAPVRRQDDGVINYIFVKEDITEKKRLLLALQAAREAADCANRAKSEFLANMSHEIRTPLNGVLGLSQIGQAESVGRRSYATFARILSTGQHLLGVVNDILDFSKIEAGKLVIENVVLDLGLTLEQAVELIQERALEKGLHFVLDKADNLPTGCMGDGLRIRQILVNLLSNAIKFTEQGRIVLSVGRDRDRLIFRISDTGIGMSDEQMGRLFAAFEQADTSTTRRYGGTGLGLAITKRLVDLMGGEIAVTSALGQGSRFEFALPLIEAEPPPRPTIPAKYDPHAGGARLRGYSILAADDNEVNRLVLEELLGSEGAQLQCAVNGQEIVDIWQRSADKPWNIVLMDIQMPVLDGYGAVRALRAAGCTLPIVGVTAHALAEEREKCLAAGMVEHVTKPVFLETLVRVVLFHTRTGNDAPATLFAAAPPSVASLPAPVAAPAIAKSPTVAASGPIDWVGLLDRYKGNQAFVTRLAASLLDSHGESPARLRELATVLDFSALAFLAHSVKGAVGNLLAESTQQLAFQAEQAARANEPGAAKLAQQLASALEEVLSAIAARVAANGKPT